MPDRHGNPTINDYVAAMITREDVRRVEFLDDGLTARVTTMEIGPHYVEMRIDDNGALIEASCLHAFDDPKRDPIMAKYPNVQNFIDWLEEGC